MTVYVPGHYYGLRQLNGHRGVFLEFVQPGVRSGTTSAEVLRVLIDRAKYLAALKSEPDRNDVYDVDAEADRLTLTTLRLALYDLETAAARRRGQPLPSHVDPYLIETYPVCRHCLHIFCRIEAHDAP